MQQIYGEGHHLVADLIIGMQQFHSFNPGHLHLKGPQVEDDETDHSLKTTTTSLRREQ